MRKRSVVVVIAVVVVVVVVIVVLDAELLSKFSQNWKILLRLEMLRNRLPDLYF